MSPHLLFLPAAGAVAGFIDAIAGGGGLITLPTLTLAVGPGAPAIGTNKIVGLTGAFIALLVYLYKHKSFDIRLSFFFSFWIMTGSWLGSAVTPYIPIRYFSFFLAATCPLILWIVWRKDLWVQQELHAHHHRSRKHFALVALSGFLCGFYDGMWGPGGGTFMFLSLLFVAKLPLFLALSLSKFANTVSAGTALVHFALGGYVHVTEGLATACGMALGSYAGASVASTRASRAVRPALVAVVTLLILRLLSQTAFAAAVATPSAHATNAALEILDEKGNAVDAMIAAALTLNVAQPQMMGIGGGGFFLVRTSKEIFFWDSRETAPASARPEMFLRSPDNPIPFSPDRITGPNPVGVPGMVAGLWEAHKKLGRLPWKNLFIPAVRLARDGVAVTDHFSDDLSRNWDRIKKFQTTAATFGDETGDFLKPGRIIIHSDLAHTFKTIASQGAASFYTGPLAQGWLAAAQKEGVKITLEDLKTYKVRTTRPISFHVFGYEGFTAPPPSSGGLMVAGVLRFLEQYYKTHARSAFDAAERVIVTTETIRAFQKLRDEKLADLSHTQIDPQKFLGSAEEKAFWEQITTTITSRLIQNAHAAPTKKYVAENFEETQSHTAHLSITDDYGISVSYTTTIEALFGSGVMVPGFGFLLNNELTDFSPDPTNINAVAVGKRPRSNMSPTILWSSPTRHGGSAAPVAIIGCAGGPRIPTAIVEVLENFYIFKMPAHLAVAAARFHPMGDKLEIEKGFSSATLEKLRRRGYDLNVVPIVRSLVQALLRHSPREPWQAIADPRFDGMGVVVNGGYPSKSRR